MQTTKLMTADELLTMPRGYGRLHELVKGELITMSPAGSGHGVVCSRLFLSLANYVAAHRLGQVLPADTGFVLARNPDTVRAPDVAFVATQRMVKTEKYFPGAPDVAAEVLSPNDRSSEVEAKVSEYLAAGTHMVIVIDPGNQTAKVTTANGTTRLTLNDTLDGADVVPGWNLPLRELFAD